MITKKCVNCGKKFTLTDSEIEFYKSKDLSIPKRCKACRDRNKKASGNSNGGRNNLKQIPFANYSHTVTVKNKKTENSTAIFVLLAVVIALFAFMTQSLIVPAVISDCLLLFIAVISFFRSREEVTVSEFNAEKYEHTFYDTDSMEKHFIKHCKDVPNCSSMEDYLKNANAIINNAPLHKKQLNGDMAYYKPATKEFVIVAKAGYIRTYYTASRYYYDKQ